MRERHHPTRTVAPSRIDAAPTDRKTSARSNEQAGGGHAFARIDVQWRDGAAEAIEPPTVAPVDALQVQRAVAPAAAVLSSSWIVDDNVAPSHGQMHRRAFVAALDAEIHATADVALAPVGRDSNGCPYIRKLLARVARMPAAALEDLARVHATPAATSALDYLPPVVARIKTGVAHWIATGRIPGDVPDERALSVAGEGDASAAAAADDAPGLSFARAAAGDAAIAQPIGDRAALRAHLGPGTPLAGADRQTLEQGFDKDLGAVRLHRGAAASALTHQLSAYAVTVGDDIAFAPGAYEPGSAAGQALLAHEVAHTLQQRGAGGPIVGLGDDAHEDDADDAARAALMRAHGSAGERPTPRSAGQLRLQRCGDGGTKSDAGPSPTVQAPTVQQPPPPPPNPARVALEAVREPAIAETQRLETANFADVLDKRDGRTKQIDELVKLTSDKDRLATLARMKTRWTGTIITDSTFNSVTGTVDSTRAADLRAKLAADQADAKAINNTGLTEKVTAMSKSLSAYLTKHQQLDEEPAQFQRFNDLFLAPNVVTILRGMGANFRPADLKAMLANESGDFTNTAVEGLAGKTAGITSNKKNKKGPSFIGIAQMNDAAKTDALAQATRLNITPPAESATDDPRKDPARAIVLAALYVSSISRDLRMNLPDTKPTGNELKKFILAAYNGGVGNVKTAARTHGKTTYTWDDIVADSAAMSVWTAAKQTEVTNYVTNIMGNAP
jgi:hypothetical protein